MQERDPFNTVFNIEEWIPFKSNRVQFPLDSLELRATLSEPTPKQSPRLLFFLGADLLKILKCNVNDRLCLLQHPREENHFLLVKGQAGYKLSPNNASKNPGARLQIAFPHPTLRYIKGEKVSYSTHPNNSITFYLRNTPQVKKIED